MADGVANVVVKALIQAAAQRGIVLSQWGGKVQVQAPEGAAPAFNLLLSQYERELLEVLPPTRDACLIHGPLHPGEAEARTCWRCHPSVMPAGFELVELDEVQRATLHASSAVVVRRTG